MARRKVSKKRRRNPHTFPSGRVLKVETIRGKRSATALMRKAAAAKRKGKRFHGDVTRAGVHRTVKSASARLQGFTADRKPNGVWEDSLAKHGS